MLNKVVPETGQAYTVGSKHFVGVRELVNNSELQAANSCLDLIGPEVKPWNLGFSQASWENLTVDLVSFEKCG